MFNALNDSPVIALRLDPERQPTWHLLVSNYNSLCKSVAFANQLRCSRECASYIRDRSRRGVVTYNIRQPFNDHMTGACWEFRCEYTVLFVQMHTCTIDPTYLLLSLRNRVTNSSICHYFQGYILPCKIFPYFMLYLAPCVTKQGYKSYVSKGYLNIINCLICVMLLVCNIFYINL